MRYLVLICVLVVAGCGTAAMYSKPEIIAASPAAVSIRAGAHINPGPMAKAHCKKYGKQTTLVSNEPTTVGGYIYRFVCS